MPSWLSHWLCCNASSWAQDVWLNIGEECSIKSVIKVVISDSLHKVLKSHRNKMGVIYACSAILTSVMDYLVEYSLVHWYQQYNQVLGLPQRHCGDDQVGTLFSWLHIYYAHLASERSEHSVRHGSLICKIK